MSEIKRLHESEIAGLFDHEYINPKIVMGPNKAFFSDKISLPITESEGKICGEFVMCYPPGIPILAPGEMITAEIINYVEGCLMTGTQDMTLEHINVVDTN